jgi:hypothetical protein
MASPLQPVLDSFAKLRATWPKRGWSWDNRFNCVASTFDVDVSAQARNLVVLALPHVWTDRTLPAAPASLRELTKRTGGIRSTQLVFSADPVMSVTPYGLWWPWEEGRTISLRIGLDAPTDYTMQLCELFGAELG